MLYIQYDELRTLVMPDIIVPTNIPQYNVEKQEADQREICRVGVSALTQPVAMAIVPNVLRSLLLGTPYTAHAHELPSPMLQLRPKQHAHAARVGETSSFAPLASQGDSHLNADAINNVNEYGNARFEEMLPEPLSDQELFQTLFGDFMDF